MFDSAPSLTELAHAKIIALSADLHAACQLPDCQEARAAIERLTSAIASANRRRPLWAS